VTLSELRVTLRGDAAHVVVPRQSVVALDLHVA
jgi:hypothetical protein